MRRKKKRTDWTKLPNETPNHEYKNLAHETVSNQWNCSRLPIRCGTPSFYVGEVIAEVSSFLICLVQNVCVCIHICYRSFYHHFKNGKKLPLQNQEVKKLWNITNPWDIFVSFPPSRFQLTIFNTVWLKSDFLADLK